MPYFLLQYYFLLGKGQSRTFSKIVFYFKVEIRGWDFVHFSLLSPNMIVKESTMVDFLQVMPLSGFLVSKLLNLPPYYAAGLILVGCCPGGMHLLVSANVTFQFHFVAPHIYMHLVAGTASNIVTYIARFVEFSMIVSLNFSVFFLKFLVTFFFPPHVCHGQTF